MPPGLTRRTERSGTRAGGYVEAERATKDLVDACLRALGESAPFFNTESTARDLDLLRAALGDARLTYVGFSYGAKLGAAYAHQFPGTVRALVLDAPSDPLAEPLMIAETQAAGVEQAFAAYADSCATRPSCTPLGDPRSYLADLIRTADSSAIPSGQPGDDRVATGFDVLSAALALLYDDATWSVLDDALREARHGDSGTVFEALDNVSDREGPDDETDAGDTGFVINCNDSAPGPSEAQIKDAAVRFRAAFPTFGALASGWLFSVHLLVRGAAHSRAPDRADRARPSRRRRDPRPGQPYSPARKRSPRPSAMRPC